MDDHGFWGKSQMMITGCREWQGYITPNGYGRATVGGRVWRVHRYAWFLAHGPIPKGMSICHHCDNRRCVNPDHLFIGTNGDNNRDAAAKRHVHRGYKLSDSDVLEIRSRVEAGIRYREIASSFRVTVSQVCQIALGQRYRELGPVNRQPRLNQVRGEAVSHKAKLRETDIPIIRNAHANGTTIATLARAYGVSFPTMACVVKRQTWKHIE